MIEQLLLRLGEQHALGVDHPLKIRVAFLVAFIRKLERALRGDERLVEQQLPLGGFHHADRGVVDLPRCLQHAVLKTFNRLLQARVLQAHIAANPAEVEHVPRQRGTGGETAAVGAGIQRIPGPADAAEQRDGREVVGFRNADLRRLRGDLPGGRADIRPAQQQLRPECP